MGREDLALDSVGRDQVEALADALSSLPLTAVWSSPLRRATQTAAALARPHRLDVSESDDLFEFDFGAASGSSSRPKVKRDHLYEPVPGGESLHDVWKRAGAFLATIEPLLTGGGTVAVVGHYRSGQLLAGRFLGATFEAAVHEPVVRLANAEAVELRPDQPPLSLWRPEA